MIFLGTFLAAVSSPASKPYRRVLLVDDDPTSRFLSKLLLEEQALAEVIVALPGVPEGIEYLQQHCLNENAAKDECPDLILLEPHQQGPDGFAFLEGLRALGQNSLIRAKVVVLSTYTFLKDRQRLSDYGVMRFMDKPLTEEKIQSLMTHQQ